MLGVTMVNQTAPINFSSYMGKKRAVSKDAQCMHSSNVPLLFTTRVDESVLIDAGNIKEASCR